MKEKVKMERVLIIGMGEVGSSLFKVLSGTYPEISGYDPNVAEYSDDAVLHPGYDVVHFCYPYSPQFEAATRNYMDKIGKVKLGIINSTVAIGTTRKFGDLFCHEPIRGVHPNLDNGITKIINYIGPNSEHAGALAYEYLKNAGLKVKLMNKSEETEVAKIFSTTYYGTCITFMKRFWEVCKELDLDFDLVYTDWNTTYNDGMVLVGLPHVRRPVLLPIDGKNGKMQSTKGHCVVPNYKLLPDEFADFRTFLSRINEFWEARNEK